VRKVVAEDFALGERIKVKILVFSGLCMNEDASSCLMIITYWFL